jgi:predicted phage terminase large subunit-like protein
LPVLNLDGLQYDVDEALLELERIELEESLYAFTVAAWPHIDSAPFAHGPFALQAVCEHLEACSYGYIPNLLINIPPRCSKSTIVGVMFPAWIWAQREKTFLRGPGVQFLCSGYALNLSQQDSVKCRNLIKSEWYQKRWGDRFKIAADQDTKLRFQNNKNGIRNAISVDSATTGLGGNYLIGDDLNNAREANSESILKTAMDWWDQAFYNRLNSSRPGQGCRIVVAQRLNEEDISGHILEKQVGSWTHLCLPMRYEPDRSFSTVLVPSWATDDGEEIQWKDPRTEPGELLWPERFGDDQVKLLEQTMGPYASAGQLQQRPEPIGGGIIKREWWGLWSDEKYPPMDYVLASLDTAYTAKQENDPSAMTIWGVFSKSAASKASHYVSRSGKMQDALEMLDAFDEGIQIKTMSDALNGGDSPAAMLMYAWQDHMEFPDLINQVIKLCKQFKVDMLLVENKAAGITLGQEIRRSFASENFGLILEDPKNLDKVARLYAVQHIFSEGMVYAPDRVYTEMVINQVSVFPKGKHDDLVDTVSQAIKFLRDRGMLSRSTEWMEQVNEAYTLHTDDARPIYEV